MAKEPKINFCHNAEFSMVVRLGCLQESVRGESAGLQVTVNKKNVLQPYLSVFRCSHSEFECC